MITPTIVAPSFRLMLVTSVHLVLLVWLWQSLPATVRAPLVLQMRMISAEPEASVASPRVPSAPGPAWPHRAHPADDRRGAVLREPPVAVLPAPTSRPVAAQPTNHSPAAVADAALTGNAAIDSPVAPAASAATSAPAEPTAPRFDVDTLDNPTPVYPALSRRLGEQGQVLLQVDVGTDGRAHEVAVNRSSGYPRLDHAALETVRRWTFIPARLGRLAIAASVLVPISFSLKE